MNQWLKNLLWFDLGEAWKARRRGERRITPDVEVRGRVYIKAEPKPRIFARVYRAAEKKWYDLEELK